MSCGAERRPADSRTRYVFVGAGAVGSALGGLLARAGTEVLLVARGEHQRRIAENGIRVRCPDVEFTVAVPSVTGPEGVALTDRDVLVLTIKTQQTEAALAQWADVEVRDPDGRVVGRASEVLPVLTALNGVAGEEIALRRRHRRDHLPQRGDRTDRPPDGQDSTDQRRPDRPCATRGPGRTRTWGHQPRWATSPAQPTTNTTRSRNQCPQHSQRSPYSPPGGSTSC